MVGLHEGWFVFLFSGHSFSLLIPASHVFISIFSTFQKMHIFKPSHKKRNDVNFQVAKKGLNFSMIFQ